MKDQQSLISLLIKIRKSFPKSNFLSSLNIFFKLFSLFLLTHDWNIHSQKGISSFLIEFTIIPTIDRINSDLVNSIITFAYIILCIIPIILLVIIYLNKSSNNEKLTQFTSIFIYFFYYLLNQHFYMLTIKSYFCKGILDNSKDYSTISSLGSDCRGVINYFAIVFQSIFIVVLFLVNYLILIVSCDPFFFTNELVLNNIGSNENQWIFYPFGLFILDLEYHIPFYVIAIIKAIVRLAFVIFFISNHLIKSTVFYSQIGFYQLHMMILSMCFVSCIIEYVFLYDWNNDLILLQSNVNYIVGKLIIEVVLSISLFYYILSKDHGHLSLHHFQEKDINEEYALYNKYFYYILNPFSNLNVTNQIILNLQKEYNENSRGKCNEIEDEYIGITYSPEDIIKQSKNYLFNIDFHQACLIDEYDDLINHFPALYKYLEFYINMRIEKMVVNHSKNYIQLIAALFYLAFQKNVNKSFFYLEEFKKSSMYKKSFICRVQIQLINEFILTENQNILKRKSNNFLSFSTEFYHLNRYIYIENQMRNIFINYIEFIHKASDLEIDQSYLITLMTKFNTDLKTNKAKFQKLLSNAKCKLGYLSTKLYLYYRFFYQVIPNEVKELFKDITKEKPNFLSIDEYSTLIISYSKNKELLFQIEYASDDFHNCLGYSYGDLKHKHLNKILLTDFAEGYSNYLYNQIQSGSSILVIPNICFKTKTSECKILFFMGIILFHGNDLHIYAKIASVDSIPYSKLDAILRNNENYVNSKKSRLMEKESCYIITNKSGRIISISEQFQSLFCLKNKFIKQNKVNIFKDILKEDLHSSEFIKTMLYIIYDNIADIIASQLLDNNRDNYDVDYWQIKEKQKNLKKHKANVSLLSYFEEDVLKRVGKNDKVFYYVIFKIQILTNNPISLICFFYKIQNTDERNIEKSKETKDLKVTPSLTKDQQDILNKISLIKAQSLKILQFYYRIDKKLLYTEEINHNYNEVNNKKEKKKKHTSLSQTIEDETNIIASNDYIKSEQKRKGNKKIYLNLMIWITSLIFYLAFYIVIGQIKEMLYTNGLELVYCNLFITVTKKVMLSVVCSVLYMQVITNELQPLVFHNGLPNGKDFHGELMMRRINDFLNNYYLFKQHFFSPNLKLNNYKDQASNVIYTIFPVRVLGDNLISINKPSNLNDVLSTFHLNVGQGFDDLLNPLLLNQTTIIDKIEYANYTSEAFKDYNYIYADRSDLISERIVVYLLENAITEFKYRLDEYINLFENISSDVYSNNYMIMLYLNLVNAVIIICVFIYQSVSYFKISQQLFVNYFISYMHIQYFNKFTIEKALILQNLMNITIESSFNTFNNTKISIHNSKNESNLLKATSKVVEEDLPLDIHSFNPIIDTIDELITPDLNSTHHIVEAILNKRNSKMTSIKYNSKLLLPITSTENKVHQQPTLTKIGNDLEKSNKQIDNTSSLITNNNTTSSINRTTETLVKTEDYINKKKQTLKAKSNGIAIGVIVFLHLTIIIFTIVYFFLMSTFFSTLYTYLQYQSFTLQRITAFHELLIIYQTSLIKNKEIIFDYQSKGLLNSTKSLAFLNEKTTRHIFNETMAKMIDLEEQYQKAINVVNKNPYQKTLKIYENIFNSENFCKENALFFQEYRQYLILPPFSSISDTSSEYLIDGCQKIGNGFNLKGFKTAMLSLINYIGNSHSDFINKKDRDGEYNLKMMNLPTVIIYQLECHRIIDSIFMNYQVSTSKDYETRYKSLTDYERLFTLLLIIYNVSLLLLYFVYFSLKFITEYLVIDDIEAVLLSSVVF